MGQESTLSRKTYLLIQCYDYHLPVSPLDSVEVLENFLKAAMDEAGKADAETSNEYPFLENDPIYIGKYESRLKMFFYKLLAF